MAVPCNVEPLHLIAAQGRAGTVLPGAATVRECKAAYLAVRDGAVGGLAPSAEYRVERREVIARTFDRSAELAERGG